MAVRGFSWEMDRVDIGSNGTTAWAWMEGRMVLTDKAGKALGKTPYRFMAILVKKGGAWAWRIFDGAVIGGEKPAIGRCLCAVSPAQSP